jgi:hypothetical protein
VGAEHIDGGRADIARVLEAVARDTPTASAICPRVTVLLLRGGMRVLLDHGARMCKLAFRVTEIQFVVFPLAFFFMRMKPLSAQTPPPISRSAR